MIKQRFVSVMLASSLAVGILFAGAAPAHARRSKENSSEKTARIATYVGAAATAYGLLNKNTTVAVIGGVGTFLAHKKWKDEVNDRHRREDRYRYGYRRR